MLFSRFHPETVKNPVDPVNPVKKITYKKNPFIIIPIVYFKASNRALIAHKAFEKYP
jgi:hypothetical protein